jgi:hypothetical protein
VHCRLKANSIEEDCLGIMEMALRYRLSSKQKIGYVDLLSLYLDCRLKGVSQEDAATIMKQASEHLKK